MCDSIQPLPPVMSSAVLFLFTCCKPGQWHNSRSPAFDFEDAAKADGVVGIVAFAVPRQTVKLHEHFRRFGRVTVAETASERVVAAGHRAAGIRLADGATDLISAAGARAAAPDDFISVSASGRLHGRV
jgi:hypothetical protein